jgi:hypothetical protein
MKTLVLAAAGVALIGSVVLLPAATQAQNGSPGIPGFLDPRTGMFTARSSFPAGDAGVALTGSITVTTNVAIDTALQKVPDQTITCTVRISTNDAVASNSATGSNNVIRAGAKGTCTTTITFIWEVASTTKTMSLSVDVSTNNFGTDQVSHDASFSTSIPMIPISTKKFTVTLAL